MLPAFGGVRSRYTAVGSIQRISHTVSKDRKGMPCMPQTSPAPKCMGRQLWPRCIATGCLQHGILWGNRSWEKTIRACDPSHTF